MIEQEKSQFEQIYLEHVNEKARIVEAAKIQKVKIICKYSLIGIIIICLTVFLVNFKYKKTTIEEYDVEQISADNNGNAIKNTGNDNNFIIGNENKIGGE